MLKYAKIIIIYIAQNVPYLILNRVSIEIKMFMPALTVETTNTGQI